MVLPHFITPFDKKFGFAVQIWTPLLMPEIYPEEWNLLSPHAVEKRRQEFWIGRVAAHQALANIGIKAPVLRGDNGEPLWPKGIVGAISHSTNIGLSAVAWQKDSDGIGIDIEFINSNITWDLADRISLPCEKKWLEEEKENCYLRFFLLFSAKETIFKAFFPQYRVFLDFKDAEISWNKEKSCLEAKLLKKVSSVYEIGYSFQIGHSIQENYVFTYLTLPPKIIV